MIKNGTSEGMGYTMVISGESSGLPPHSLIPKGVKFTSPDDLAVENWFNQASKTIQKNTKAMYIEGKKISKDQHSFLLKSAAKWLFN